MKEIGIFGLQFNKLINSYHLTGKMESSHLCKYVPKLKADSDQIPNNSLLYEASWVSFAETEG